MEAFQFDRHDKYVNVPELIFPSIPVDCPPAPAAVGSVEAALGSVLPVLPLPWFEAISLTLFNRPDIFLSFRLVRLLWIRKS
jgi:hypothetical protein